MRKSTKFEETYDALGRIESGPVTPESIDMLRSALNGSVSLLAAEAAGIAGRIGLKELIPDMIATFDRFMIDGAKIDKACNAKSAIAEALGKLEYMGDAVFATAAQYIQMEPAFGGQVDTAVQLRCMCAYGVARTNHPDAYFILTEQLVDKEPAVRAASAKALGHLGTPESEVLLRLVVLSGEDEPDVLSECFTSLISMSAERSLDFVARYLNSLNPAIGECAALAIGESRNPRAYDILRDAWDDDLSPTRRKRLMLPIALVRSAEAFNFLLNIVRHSEKSMASEALTALNLYMDDESIAKLREAVTERNDEEITVKFRQEFGW